MHRTVRSVVYVVRRNAAQRSLVANHDGSDTSELLAGNFRRRSIAQRSYARVAEICTLGVAARFPGAAISHVMARTAKSGSSGTGVPQEQVFRSRIAVSTEHGCSDRCTVMFFSRITVARKSTETTVQSRKTRRGR